MLNTALFKFLTQPVAGVVIFVTMIFFPSTTLAEINTISTNAPLDTLTTTNAPLNTLTTTQPQETLDRNYTLGGGDRIRVNVFEVPEYTGEYQIPPGGRINLPLIGSIPLEGLTTEQAADNIAKKYRRYLKRPLISVNLLSPRPINVFVSGEITRPGSYSLSLQGSGGNNPGVQYPTVLAALTAAQGVTMTADITQVEVKRRGKVVPLNLKKWVTTGQVPQDITLRDGDTIFVPTAPVPNLAEARNLAALNFAASPSAPRTVAVIGEVNRPGAYLVNVNNANNNQNTQPGGGDNVANLPTLSRVIQQAGGITSQANVRKVTIRRPTKTGSEQNIDINLWQLLQSGDISQDVILQDGDTIVVPTATEINPAEATQLATTTLSPAEIEVGVVGEVKNPGRVTIRPNSPLNDALLAAGGFNDSRAKRKKITLVRLNPNGSVTKRQIKVDLASGINEQTNPILRNDDVILVGRSTIAKAADPLSIILGPVGGAINVLRFFFGL